LYLHLVEAGGRVLVNRQESTPLMLVGILSIRKEKLKLTSL